MSNATIEVGEIELDAQDVLDAAEQLPDDGNIKENVAAVGSVVLFGDGAHDRDVKATTVDKLIEISDEKADLVFEDCTRYRSIRSFVSDAEGVLGPQTKVAYVRDEFASNNVVEETAHGESGDVKIKYTYFTDVECHQMQDNPHLSIVRIGRDDNHAVVQLDVDDAALE